MKKRNYLLLLCILLTISSFAQDTLFFENFDEYPGEKPPAWSAAQESGGSKWQFVNGGGTKNPGIPGSRKPPSAYSGEVNALYFFESLGGESVYLITPPVNLEFALKPELHFRHAQQEGNLGFGSAHDELRIYFKTHIDSAWTEANKIAEYVDAVENWTEQLVLLPEEALVPECYFAFKATTNYGWGVCLDDITIIETEFEEREVDSVSITREAFNYIPSGTRQAPITRIEVAVTGNTGSAIIESMEVNALNSSNEDIPVNGVKLHYNPFNKNYYSSTVLDSASIISGKVNFTNIDTDLPTGFSYFWISYDIRETAIHANIADASFSANSIEIDGGTYPAADVSPPGSSIIRQSVFFDDFSSDLGWLLSGDFERDRPAGNGGVYLGNPDPVFALADTFILGNDLSGLGAIIGDYEPNVPRYGNLATSPASNLFYYNDVRINFLRWLNVANNDTASIEMSEDDGSTWHEVWSNNNNVFSDADWKPFILVLPQADRKPSVMFRFNLGPTTLTDHFSGWNIENFAITGNYIDYDIGPVTMLSPSAGCGLSTNETVGVRIKNFGPGATPDTLPLRFSINGGLSYEYDTLYNSIPFEGTYDFQFSQLVDLSAPGAYDVIIETLLSVDEESENNLLDTVLYSDPSYSLPYLEDFESGEGFWRVEGTNKSWEHGRPMGGIIHTTPSGTNAWVTDLDGDYEDNESSFLVGPCIDFTGIDFPVFEFNIFYYTDEGKDGTNVEYSLDNGQTWTRLGNSGDGNAYQWNWYNASTITSLPGGHGWTGSSGDWKTARYMLDTLIFRNYPSAKFRIRFNSDAADRIEGVAIDDIHIYNAPRDVGVTSVVAPASGCLQDIGDHVSITIQNYGLDTLMAGEQLIAGYRLEENDQTIDTFYLASNLLSGDTYTYTFSERLGAPQTGWNEIVAYTLLPDEINIYNQSFSNDTTFHSFEVKETPFIELPDNIYTVRPDTVVLNAYTGDITDTYLWQDGSTDATFSVSDISDGLYSVEVSNGLCSYRDTAYIWRLLADAAVTELLNPLSDCELGKVVYPEVRITNFGTDTLDPGDIIPVRYILDAGTTIKENAVVPGLIYPDSSFSFSFTTPSDFSAVKTYALSFYTELPYDNNTDNDQLDAFPQSFGYTPIDLEEKIMVRSMQYTLNAGSGYDSYLWSDGSAGQTLEVNSSGSYDVTVQQGSMCPSSDTVEVFLIIQDLIASHPLQPLDACELSNAEHLAFHIKNVGSDTLFVEDTVLVTYQVNGGTAQEDSIFINREVVPGDSVRFTSAGTIDMQSAGSYTFSSEIALNHELITDNNQLAWSAEVFGSPTIDLGDDIITSDKIYMLKSPAEYEAYLWQDRSNADFYLAYYRNQAAGSTYNLTVTDANGCQGMDSVRVIFDISDLGIESVNRPLSDCELGANEEVRIRIENAGTRNILNQSFDLQLSVDGTPLKDTTILISETFLPEQVRNISLGSSYDFSEVGSYNLEVTLVFTPDDDPLNDQLSGTVNHFGYPQPDLGEDNTINMALPGYIDAGQNYATILWNGTEGSQLEEVTNYGWLVLEVWDNHGCYGIDSVLISPLTALESYIPNAQLKVYPQPATDILFLEYSHPEEADLFLELIDATGRVLMQRKYSQQRQINETLSISALQPGVYSLWIRTSESRIGKQILIR